MYTIQHICHHLSKTTFRPVRVEQEVEKQRSYGAVRLTLYYIHYQEEDEIILFTLLKTGMRINSTRFLITVATGAY